jgi:hypothetical protein
MDWDCSIEEVEGGRGVRYGVRRGGAAMSQREMIEAWRGDAGFREWFNGVLAGVKFGAFKWETPGVTLGTFGRAFEFVVLDCPQLERRVEPRMFAKELKACAGTVGAFSNLGGDAVLVVPKAVGEGRVYGHLGAFVRGAPAEQRGELWRVVGEAMAQRVSKKAVWLSTAGMGVGWLHVRLDDRPKYYGFGAYRG